jgi:Raf kinase inhibitor-like YbhB/YbcL family protein
MDDLDFPLGVFNHWVIWNIPPQTQIPEAIPHGAVVNSLGGAIQGKGYGINQYKGPNPPFGTHRYKFNVYVLDTKINLDSKADKKELLKQMDGHILQYGSITGKFK